MLGTEDRALLVDLLGAPGDGFRLERAVGTTFTLHLDALLRVPLAVVGAEWTEGSDPLGVLHALQSTVDRIDVFCQAGMIRVPPDGAGILGFVEPVVHQVRRPRPGRLFHPKIWVLSFVRDSGERRMRLLCGSRNLTNDRTWDAVVALEGPVSGRAHAVNRPLSELVASLPDRVPTGMPADRAAAIAEVAELVRRVDWERPDGVVSDDWLAFHVFGAGRRPTPDLSGSRRLIISPFLSADGLDIVWPEHTGATIVSRTESFATLEPEVRDDLVDEWGARLFVLDDAAAVPDVDGAEAGRRWELVGLHAKVYLVERNRRVHIFVGSANATENGWSGNDELLVELVGSRSKLGIDRVLGERDGALSSVLLPFAGGDAEPTDDDGLRRQLEHALVGLAELHYVADATQQPDSRWAETVRSLERVPPLPDGAVLSLRLLTARGERRIGSGSPVHEDWVGLDPEELSPFVALTLRAGPLSSPTEVATIVVARLAGAPDDRLDRLLARQIGTPTDFLRFLLLLLSTDGDGFPACALTGAGASNSANPFGLASAGVLESLVMALADRPELLDDVDRLVSRLGATDAGREVLPDGWDEMWTQVRAARVALEDGSP